jgi:hypothetical protein
MKMISNARVIENEGGGGYLRFFNTNNIDSWSRSVQLSWRKDPSHSFEDSSSGDGDKKSNETEDEVTGLTETNNYLPLKDNSKKWISLYPFQRWKMLLVKRRIRTWPLFLWRKEERITKGFWAGLIVRGPTQYA